MKLRKHNWYASYGTIDFFDLKKTPSRAFLEGFVSGLGGGQLFFEFDPPRYPVRDAQRGDLTRIGRDMYKAMENYPLTVKQRPTKKGTQANS